MHFFLRLPVCQCFECDAGSVLRIVKRGWRMFLVGTAGEVMNIGDVAIASGVSARMIRHYEKIGLIPAVARRGGGYRAYSGADVHRLRFIANARDLGFRIEEISMLLDLWAIPDRTGADVSLLVTEHIAMFRRKAEMLVAMQQALLDLIGQVYDGRCPTHPILPEPARTD